MSTSIGAGGSAAPLTVLRDEHALQAASTDSHTPIAPGLDALANAANSVGITPESSARLMGGVGPTPQALGAMANAENMTMSRNRQGYTRVDEEVILNPASTPIWPGPTRTDTQIDPRYGADWLIPSQPRPVAPHFTPTQMPHAPRDHHMTPTADEKTIPTH